MSVVMKETEDFLSFRISNILLFEVKDRYDLMVNCDLISDEMVVNAHKEEVKAYLRQHESVAFIYEDWRLIYPNSHSGTIRRMGQLADDRAGMEAFGFVTEDGIFTSIYFSKFDWYLGIGMPLS